MTKVICFQPDPGPFRLSMKTTVALKRRGLCLPGLHRGSVLRGLTTHSYSFRSQLKDVRVVSRHWKIYDNNNKLVVEVPRGSPGILGQTPCIRPGGTFEYYSGTDIEAADGGYMLGSLRCVTPDDGEEFDAIVPRFDFRT
jgi:uncharacterized protein affecting Mg2+/Co2+ transport